MDRNNGTTYERLAEKVATREGGVDRNVQLLIWQKAIVVATREGGVDRNIANRAQMNQDGSRHPRGWRG